MSHEEWTEQLDTYLDGELTDAEARELDGHLRTCPTCAAEAVRRMQWKKAIKSAGGRYLKEAPRSSELLARSMPTAVLRPSDRSSKTFFGMPTGFAAGKLWGTAALAMAAILVVAGFVVNQGKLRQSASDRVLAELVDLHVATLASANPVDVVSSDRHTVKPWFAGKIPFTFDLPDLQGTPFELVGGRLSYLEQTPGAELLFTIRKHQVSVFIFPANALPDFTASGPANANTFHTEIFTRGHLRYFVVGDVSVDDIHQLAASFH